MAKEDYFFKLKYKQLLASTIGWTDEEFGAYLRLLIHQFDNENSIENDLKKLKRIAPSVKKNWPLLSKKFKQNEDGNLYNEVMSDTYNDAQAKKLKNKENGEKGGRPKKANGFENQNPNETQTKPKLVKNENPNHVKSETQTKPTSVISNQESVISNSSKEYIVQNNVVETPAPKIPPPASTARFDKLYEYFYRASGWNPEVIREQIGFFENKYASVPLNQVGALINTWIANYKPVDARDLSTEEFNNNASNWI